MVDRIKKVMEFKDFNKSSFARAIGIDPSRMTHIFNGHNEPTLDMVRRIVVAFPDVSSEWLISGIGNMIKDDFVEPSPVEQAPEPTVRMVDNMQQTSLFDFDEPEPVAMESELEQEPAPIVDDKKESVVESVDASEGSPAPSPVEATVLKTETVVDESQKAPQPEKVRVPMPRNRAKTAESHFQGANTKRDRISNSQGDRKLVKIVFFYDDRSFEEYRPS